MATSKGFQQTPYLLSSAPSSLSAVTAAEVAAGIAMDDAIPDPVSFSATTNRVDVSVLQRQDQFEPGTLTPDEISIEVYRNSAGATLLAAITPDNSYWLVKFEGGDIAAGDHGTPAAGDTYDAVEVVAGARSDVDGPRNEARRTTVSLQIAGQIEWAATLA